MTGARYNVNCGRRVGNAYEEEPGGPDKLTRGGIVHLQPLCLLFVRHSQLSAVQSRKYSSTAAAVTVNHDRPWSIELLHHRSPSERAIDRPINRQSP